MPDINIRKMSGNEKMLPDLRDLADYIHLTDLMQNHGANLQMPPSRAMGGGLFELRPKGKEGIGRVFYCTQIGQAIVILHSLVKKTNTTPAAD